MRTIDEINKDLEATAKDFTEAQKAYDDAQNDTDRNSAGERVKELGNKYEAFANERDVVQASENIRARDEAWQELSVRRVEAGGDTSYRRDTGVVADASDLEEPTPEVRTRRDNLWTRHLRGEQLSEADHVERLTRFPEDRRFMEFVRFGNRTTALNTGTTSSATGASLQGNHVIPTLLSSSVIEKMAFVGPMLQVSRVEMTATGAQTSFPTWDSTADNVSIKQEATNFDDGIALPLENITVSTQTFRAKPFVVSYELLQDSVVDLESRITSYFGTVFGRSLNKFATTGTGSGQPKGIMNAPPSGQTETAASGNTTKATLQELMMVTGQVDPVYQVGSVYQMNQKSMLHFRTKTVGGTSDTRFVWEPNPQVGQPANFAGYNVLINPAMVDMAANAFPVVFGNFDNYIIHIAREMTMLRSEHTHANQFSVAYYSAMRAGGQIAQPVAFGYLKNAAS